MKKRLIIIVCCLLNLSIKAQETRPFVLWDENVPFPPKEEIPVLENVEFSVIKPYEFYKDGYRFLHGVAIMWYEDKIYASFGHNKNGENTVTEEANYRASEDGGKTWGAVKRIAIGIKLICVNRHKSENFGGSGMNHKSLETKRGVGEDMATGKN